MRKLQLCLVSDNTKDILSITGTKTNHPKRCESFNSVWYWTTQKIFYGLQEPKQIIPKDVKVSTLFGIGQHKRYFMDYRNQNKSSQKMQKFQLCLVLDNTKHILPITGTKTNHPKRCESFNSVWYWTTQMIFYRLQEPKQIVPKDAKVSTVWYWTTQKIFYRLQEPKQIIPKGGGGWRRRHHSPPILGSVMGKASIVHNLK